jgi:hypothetical protein
MDLKLVPSEETGFALFGPDFGVPWGGFCASVFVVVTRGRKVLVGRMAEDPRWDDEWNPNMRFYDGERRAALYQGVRFPATYLKLGEHPEAAAKRVWTDQLGLSGAPKLAAPVIVSEAGPSRRYPDRLHWDICFVYGARVGASATPSGAHWAATEWRDIDALDANELVMLHGELVPLLRDAKRGFFGVRSDAGTMAARKKKGRGKLTKKQHAQRKYAARMRGVRKRAAKAGKGKGRVRKRAAATKMRRKMGLK